MSRQARSRHAQPRRFGFEALENRQMLASNVTAVLSNGVLTITGTDDIDLVSTGASGNFANLIISGAVGTTTINGLNSVTFSFAQVQNIVVNLKGESDRFTLLNTNIPGNITLTMGAGDDRVDTQSSSAKNVTINLGEGDDSVNAIGALQSSLTTVEACVINAGSGKDVLELENFNCITDLIVNGDADRDDIQISLSSAGRSLSVTGGGDSDQIVVENFTAIDQMAVNAGNPPITINTVNGIQIQNPGLADPTPNTIVVRFSSVGKNATFLGGAAADLIRVEGNNFLGTNYINGKEGNDTIQLSGCISNTFDYVFGGEGNDNISINACNVNNGKIEIKAAGGNDTVTMNGCIADTIFADLGDNDDVLTLTNNTFRLSSGNELRGGRGFDRLIRTNNSATLKSALVVEFEQF